MKDIVFLDPNEHEEFLPHPESDESTDAAIDAILTDEEKSWPECKGCGRNNDFGLPLLSSGRCSACQRVFDFEHSQIQDKRSYALKTIEREVENLKPVRDNLFEEYQRAHERCNDYHDRFKKADDRLQALSRVQMILEAQETPE